MNLWTINTTYKEDRTSLDTKHKEDGTMNTHPWTLNTRKAVNELTMFSAVNSGWSPITHLGNSKAGTLHRKDNSCRLRVKKATKQTHPHTYFNHQFVGGCKTG